MNVSPRNHTCTGTFQGTCKRSWPGHARRNSWRTKTQEPILFFKEYWHFRNFQGNCFFRCFLLMKKGSGIKTLSWTINDNPQVICLVCYTLQTCIDCVCGMMCLTIWPAWVVKAGSMLPDITPTSRALNGPVCVTTGHVSLPLKRSHRCGGLGIAWGGRL